MKNISKLMTRLCPNGVEYRQLQEIFDIKQGREVALYNRKFDNDNTVPWFQLSDIVKNGSILNNAEEQVAAKSVNNMQLFPENSIIVAISAGTGKHAHITVPYLMDEDFVSLSIKPEFAKQIDIRFANYFCFILDNWCIAKTTRFLFSPVKIDELKCFKFPVPPLPVQREINRFLDDFTNLEAVLESELEARRKQYEYYLDLLLSFDETSIEANGNSARWQTLEEVGEFVSENGLLKSDSNGSGVGLIKSRQIFNHSGIFSNQTNQLISESATKNLKIAKKGDLIIASSSDVDDNVCKAFVWLGDKVAVDHDVYVYRHTLDPKFVAFYFRTKYFHRQKKPFITGIIDRWISVDSINKMKIPVPSIKEQKRIVKILGQFDALVNDYHEGLPAEISARQRQQKHYLNKILRFKELT